LKPLSPPIQVFRPLSRPARGAWIETGKTNNERDMTHVAPRAGRVD